MHSTKARVQLCSTTVMFLFSVPVKLEILPLRLIPMAAEHQDRRARGKSATSMGTSSRQVRYSIRVMGLEQLCCQTEMFSSQVEARAPRVGRQGVKAGRWFPRAHSSTHGMAAIR